MQPTTMPRTPKVSSVCTRTRCSTSSPCGTRPGLVGAALLGAPLIARAARDRRVGPETATAVAVTGMLGLGVLMALAPATPQRLGELLFGNPLSAGTGDVLAALALALLGGGALVALQRPLALVAFD